MVSLHEAIVMLRQIRLRQQETLLRLVGRIQICPTLFSTLQHYLPAYSKFLPIHTMIVRFEPCSKASSLATLPALCTHLPSSLHHVNQLFNFAYHYANDIVSSDMFFRLIIAKFPTVPFLSIAPMDGVVSPKLFCGKFIFMNHMFNSAQFLRHLPSQKNPSLFIWNEEQN